MLSERDRRALEGIEQELTATDPALVRRLRRTRRPRLTRFGPALLAVLGTVLAVLLMMLGLVGHAFLVLAVLGWPLALRVYRARRAAAATDSERDRR